MKCGSLVWTKPFSKVLCQGTVFPSLLPPGVPTCLLAGFFPSVTCMVSVPEGSTAFMLLAFWPKKESCPRCSLLKLSSCASPAAHWGCVLPEMDRRYLCTETGLFMSNSNIHPAFLVAPFVFSAHSRCHPPRTLQQALSQFTLNICLPVPFEEPSLVAAEV